MLNLDHILSMNLVVAATVSIHRVLFVAPAVLATDLSRYPLPMRGGAQLSIYVLRCLVIASLSRTV